MGTAVFTPDGEHVAYTLSVQADPAEENVPASSQVWVVNVDSVVSTLYATRGNARGLAVRPEHNRLTFVDELGGTNWRACTRSPSAVAKP